VVYPADWPLEATAEATATADGTAQALVTVPGGERWHVTMLAATGNSDAMPKLRVFKAAMLVDSTAHANVDTSQTDLSLFAGEGLRAEWEGCTPGAIMRLGILGKVAR
jgi:hypothetical protein